MVQFIDLPADVVDKILICLPDFRSLDAAIRTSKEYIYDVFRGHRQTILTAVALNLVGPSLPHAIRLAVWQNHWSEPVSRDDLSYDESIEAATAFLCDMGTEYRRDIEKNIIPIRKLEDMYSQIYKDRRSKTSVLTDLESSRLRTALYRIWQFCISCGNTEIEFAQQWDSGWSALVAQFTAYKLQDLHDIIAVASFLREALRRCIKADFNSYTMHAGTVTPPSIIGNPWVVIEWLEAPNYWRELDDEPDSEKLPATMFEAALEKTCFKRGLKTEDTLAIAPGSLISAIHGVNDKCYGCGEVRGLELYGRPNWHLLGGILGMSSIRNNLPGVLGRNAVENDAITTFFDHYSNFTWDTFTEELFDVDTNDGAVWEKEEWYCTACMTNLYTSRFPSWYIAKPKGAWAPVKEDCWYGWNCRTQIHKWSHAQKLNHFCEPSRGDGKTPEEAWSHQ